MRKLVKNSTLIFVFILISVFFVFRSDYLLFEWSKDLINHYEKKIIKRANQKGVYGFFGFDEAHVQEKILHKQCRSFGAVPVKGKYKSARYFNASDKTFIDTDYHWEILRSQYTLSCWVKIEKGRKTQAFFCQQVGDLKSGLMLENGKIAFHVPSMKNNQMAAYEFKRFGKWVHLTATCDLESGKAKLYENAVLKDEISIENVEQPDITIKFGKFRRFHVYHPFKGYLDEVVLFKKALTPEEIESIMEASRSYYNTISSSYLFKMNTITFLRDAVLLIDHLIDFFNPFYHESRIFKSDINQFEFVLSKKDMQYFNSKFNQLKDNGYILKNNKRKAQIFFKNQLHSAEIKLLDVKNNFKSIKRKSFAVDFKDNNLEVKKMFFTPFESAGFLSPGFYSEIRQKYFNENTNSGLSALKINGVFEGVYYFWEHERRSSIGPFNNIRNSKILKLPIDKTEYIKFYKTQVEKFKPVLLSDKKCGLSIREINYNIKDELRKIKKEILSKKHLTPKEKLKLLYDFITPEMFIKENPSPDYITGDLDFIEMKFPDIKVTWKSSDSEHLTTAGIVKRDEELHKAVVMTAILSSEKEKMEKKLHFTILPKCVLLPVLKINFNDNIQNIHRIPCQLILRENGRSKISLGGEIKLRGNTALFYEKKSYSVKTDFPHNIFSHSESDEFNLMGVMPDRTLMRNSLAYGLFNSFKDSKESSDFAPEVKYVEVFINEQYHGIYELSQKVDNVMLGLNVYNPKDERQSVIYKAQGANATFRAIRKKNYIQKYPDPEKNPYFQPFEDLIGFISGSSTEDFQKKISEYVDINNIIDFHILVNLAFNKDGIRHNLFLSRNSKDGDKFFIVPWDYDKSFGLNTDGWLSNYLIDRLLKELPGYRQQFKKRWFALREKQLKYESILNLIQGFENQIKNRVEFNFKKWQKKGSNFSQAKSELKLWVKKRLEFMDGYIESL